MEQLCMAVLRIGTIRSCLLYSYWKKGDRRDGCDADKHNTLQQALRNDCAHAKML